MRLIDGLLQDTSRTFALSIPMLPVSLRDQVAISYLLFRIADTIEDESSAATSVRVELLRAIAHIDLATLGHSDQFRSVVTSIAPGADQVACAMLMNHVHEVIDAYVMLPVSVQATIAAALKRTCEGMADHLEADQPPETIEGLRAYCYTVAGIVGELLTDLFIAEQPELGTEHSLLFELAPSFGEALQLVNILRDESVDAASQRWYVPKGVDRAELFDLAERSLSSAGSYIDALARGGASRGVVAFNVMNAALAAETLALVRSSGPGVKVARDRVLMLRDSLAKQDSDPFTSLTESFERARLKPAVWMNTSR